MTELALPSRGKDREQGLIDLAEKLKEIDQQIGFKVSSRGWCYQLEQFRLINKGEFDYVQDLIVDCRKKGYLPIDFVMEDEGRKFLGIEIPDGRTPLEYMKRYITLLLDSQEWYTPDWWEGEEYYIQMLGEKIDLKTLFRPVCEEYHIPIATSKGWSSMLQRGEFARRFKEAEEQGLKCVLLYCGDHDPDGGRISDKIQKNLEDLTDIVWGSGETGYDPANLIIARFGLNPDFIFKNNLTWIDNLITGSGGYLAEVVDGQIVQGKTKAGRPHPNFHLPYVQEYLKDFGVRKCEANALVVRPTEGQDLCREAIEKYLGHALNRFEAKREEVRKRFKKTRKDAGLEEPLRQIIERFEDEEDRSAGV